MTLLAAFFPAAAQPREQQMNDTDYLPLSWDQVQRLRASCVDVPTDRLLIRFGPCGHRFAAVPTYGGQP